MKNKINIKSLVCGAVLGAVVVLSVGGAAERSDESSLSKAWDYKVLQGHVSIDFEKKLKQAGDEGWSVVSATSPDGSAGLVLAILKRDK